MSDGRHPQPGRYTATISVGLDAIHGTDARQQLEMRLEGTGLDLREIHTVTVEGAGDGA